MKHKNITNDDDTVGGRRHETKEEGGKTRFIGSTSACSKQLDATKEQQQ